MKKARYIRRSYSHEHHAESINLDTFETDKPIVICLSGNACMTEADANGFCKLAEHQLKLLFDGRENPNVLDYVDLIGVAYPTVEGLDQGKLRDEDIKNIVNKLILPRLVSDDGKKISVDEACRRFSQITFFNFCHGQYEYVRIGVQLMKSLAVAGYNSQEIEEIFKSSMSITYAGVNPVDVLPSVRIDSGHDKTVNFDWFMEGSEYFLGYDLDGIDIKLENEGDKTPSGASMARMGCLHVYSSKLMNNSTKENSEHPVKIMDRDGGWNASFKNSKGRIIKVGENGDCVSQIMSWTLCRAVENGIVNCQSNSYVPKMSLAELQEEAESIKGAYSDLDLQGPGFGF